MKAILVQVPLWQTQTPPYNLALLKAVCAASGHTIRCLDLNLRFHKLLLERNESYIYDTPTNWYSREYTAELSAYYSDFLEACAREISGSDCKVAGFTATGLNLAFTIEIARRVKELCREKFILLGGAACFKNERGPEILEQESCIDALCYAEGEKALPGLLSALEKGEAASSVTGIVSRDGSGEVLDPGEAEPVRALSELPFADYSDFNLEGYGLRELPIATSRGCINRCAFCSEAGSWKQYRFRSPENIRAELAYQKKMYPGTGSFFFNDSLINGEIDMLDALCGLLLEKGPEITWGGQAFLREEMDKPLLEKMHRSGFRHVCYGLESASRRVLRSINKGFSPELAERVIRDTKESGVRTSVSVIVGFPGEEQEDLRQTAEFLKKNSDFIDDLLFHPLVISSGSYFSEHRQELGISFKDETNSTRWYCEKDGNTLESRLKALEFYREYLGRESSGFFSPEDYFMLLGDDASGRGDREKARGYYSRALELTGDKFKASVIDKKIRFRAISSVG